MLRRLCGVVALWLICFVLAMLYFWQGKKVPPSPELIVLAVTNATYVTLSIISFMVLLFASLGSIFMILDVDPPWK